MHVYTIKLSSSHQLTWSRQRAGRSFLTNYSSESPATVTESRMKSDQESVHLSETWIPACCASAVCMIMQFNNILVWWLAVDHCILVTVDKVLERLWDKINIVCFLVCTSKIYWQEALLLQRNCAMRFVTRNNKSDFHTHSRSLVFVPFDRPYMISYQSSIVTMSLSCTVFYIVLLIFQNFKRSRDPNYAH